jgi:hypothetical protein
MCRRIQRLLLPESRSLTFDVAAIALAAFYLGF